MAISEDTLHFVRSKIKSVWALELLLFLHGNPSKSWSVDALTAELRSSRFVVSEVMAAFEASGLVIEEAEGLYRYHPASSQLDRLVQQVETAYAERPVALVKTILTAPNDKIQTFADAFRLKKD